MLGALQALREAGKDRPDQFIGGIDGEPEAIAEITKGGPYKMTVSLNSPIFGYAMGQHAADWLEGKPIPQAMDILPHVITAQNLATIRRMLPIQARSMPILPEEMPIQIVNLDIHPPASLAPIETARRAPRRSRHDLFVSCHQMIVIGESLEGGFQMSRSNLPRAPKRRDRSLTAIRKYARGGQPVRPDVWYRSWRTAKLAGF
ncbi:sugar ABC transporter substrate-binding protein [Mesorhizobium sp. 131-2-5]|uniref:sugar ABC transporter substrate-binding protein n=1 Tax=Mesorhizobium sp. 131-2-5 TaxID=2744519 RepID=UPI00313DA7CA